jgi:hypothetical protein
MIQRIAPRLLSPDVPKLVFTILAVAAVYYAAARIGLVLAFEQTNASPVWPPAGIAVALVALLGQHIWPGIFLGALLANYVVFVESASTAPSSTVPESAWPVWRASSGATAGTTGRQAKSLKVPVSTLPSAMMGTAGKQPPQRGHPLVSRKRFPGYLPPPPSSKSICKVNTSSSSGLLHLSRFLTGLQPSERFFRFIAITIFLLLSTA